MIRSFWRTLLLLVWPLSFFRLHASGGDGGASEMRADEQERQRKVQEAVDVINRRFGTPGARNIKAPDRNAFYRDKTTGELLPVVDPNRFGTSMGTDLTDSGGTGDGYGGTVPGADGRVFDEAAFNQATAAWRAEMAAPDSEAAANKAAREAMYGDISSAVRDTAMRDLDRQYTTASRRNKFGLARSGLMGSSVDAEAGGELNTLYGEGKLKATQAGQAAGSDLRVTDERTRQNLIQLAQSGLDTGTAASLAAGQMSAAADLAKNQAAGASVGRLFDDMSQAYVSNQVMRARYPGAGTQQQQSSSYGYGGFNPSRYTGTVQR